MAIKYLDAKRVRGSSTADATPDYTSDFTSVGSDGNGVGWTGSDTSKFYVDASEDKYFFDTLADHKSSYFDLDNATNAPNVGTLTTSYVVRWKMKFAAVDTGGTYWEIGLSDGTGERNANQHFNGIHMREDHFRISVTKDNQAPDGASGTYLSAVSPTETFNTTDTIYFELIRDGVDFTLNRYTADDYSTGKTTPCTLTINNSTWVGAPAAIMRYFRIITNNTEQFTGHVWDVKFYNDVTSTTQDEKATLVTTAATKNAGWTQNVATGSMPQVVDGTGIDLDTAGASGTNKVRHLIGSTLSNTAWVMRFKLNHKDSGGAESPLLCLCANNTTGNDFYDDALMVFANSTGSNPAELRATYYTSGGGSNGQSTGITLVDATTYYVELIRTAANTLTISVFTGSDYSTGQVSSTQTVTSSNITGIDDLISIQTGLGTTNGARDIDVVIQEIKIYNGVTSATGTPVYETNFSTSSDLPENTLFEETDTRKVYWLQDNAWALSTPAALNMTYANSTAADAVWIPDGDATTGEGIIKIDTTNNYLKDYWDTTTTTFRLSQNTYDLGSSLGTTWTVQYTVNFSNWRDPTSSNYVWGIGMWGSPSSSSMNTSQDRLVCFVNNSSAWTIWDTSGATASGDGSMGALRSATGTSGSPSAVPSASTNSKDWFVTLQKVDATKYTVVVREDSHTGTIIGARKEQTWQTGTPSGFRYFGAKCTMSNSARTGMIIKDVLVYDGALVGSI